jgi:hypothetical protein
MKFSTIEFMVFAVMNCPMSFHRGSILLYPNVAQGSVQSYLRCWRAGTPGFVMFRRRLVWELWLWMQLPRWTRARLVLNDCYWLRSTSTAPNPWTNCVDCLGSGSDGDVRHGRLRYVTAVLRRQKALGGRFVVIYI